MRDLLENGDLDVLVGIVIAADMKGALAPRTPIYNEKSKVYETRIIAEIRNLIHVYRGRHLDSWAPYV
jgi:hypothetical protein